MGPRHHHPPPEVFVISRHHTTTNVPVQYNEARLNRLRISTLETLAGSLLVSGPLEAALDAATTAAELDPLRESAQRMLLRIHLTAGNTMGPPGAVTEAIKQFFCRNAASAHPLPSPDLSSLCFRFPRNNRRPQPRSSPRCQLASVLRIGPLFAEWIVTRQ
ncbi:bacterial transcriptional activator domain-containing protein [Arthrobacter antioxidans]|uniref:bacterial transcriptional activator domain-containing protein n=1 Tax=Arthrobacter antioxidans TaxID=2895818 RepID=UPI003AF11DB2